MVRAAGRLASKTAAAAAKRVASVAGRAAATKKVDAPAEQVVAEELPPSQSSPAKKAPAKKAPAKKAPAKKAPAKKAPAKKAPAKKSVATPADAPASAPKRTAKKTINKSTPPALSVRDDETPWTSEELAEVTAGLNADVVRLEDEIAVAARDLDGLMRDAADGGGDEADVGSTTFERDHELSLARNHQDMLMQTRHALERLVDGTYGACEGCGQPIGKNRLMAFPRATLCMTCKQREERR